MLPVRFTRVGMVGVTALVCASAGASTITFMLDGPTSAGGTLFSSSATYGGQTYTLQFSAPVGGTSKFSTASNQGVQLSATSNGWTSATVSLSAPAGKRLLFTGYRQFGGYLLGAGSTFDLGTSVGNVLPSTGGSWPPPSAVDFVAQGAFTLGDTETATWENNTVWGGIGASSWVESFTFQVQAAAVPAPFAASGAAALLALTGPFGRRRRR